MIVIGYDVKFSVARDVPEKNESVREKRNKRMKGRKKEERKNERVREKE